MPFAIDEPEYVNRRSRDKHVDAYGKLALDHMSDGRTISVPLSWYPRLLQASQKERQNWRLIGKEQGVHWKAIDEDISVEGLLAGKPSGESQSSFAAWLANRASRLTKRSNGRGRRR